MKSVQNKQQSHNILYGNRVDCTTSNTKLSQPCFSQSSYGQRAHGSPQNHFLYSSNVGGYRQSLSGSETDLSTSTENLTHEEKYVLRNSTRQEPQGEETLNVEDSGSGGGVGTFRGGGSSYTSMDQSSCSTLIIHRDCEGDFEDEYEDDDEDDAHNSHSMDTRQKYVPTRNGLVYSGEVRPELHHHPMSANFYSGSVPYHNCQLMQKQQQQLMYMGQNSFSSSPYCKMEYAQHFPPEITGISKQYLDQSEVLKHLAKEMHPSAVVCTAQPAVLKMSDALPQNAPYSNHYSSGVGPVVSQAFFGTEFDLSKLPPPPEYPGHLNPQSKGSSAGSTIATTSSTVAMSPSGLQTPISSSLQVPAKVVAPSTITTTVTTTTTNSRNSNNKSALSRSQPDLSQLGRWDDVGVRRNNYLSQRPKTKGKASPDLSPALLHKRVHDVKYGAGNLPTMDFAMEKRIEAVEEENLRLKTELELYTTKVSKLQKFEVDIQKLNNAHEDLVKSSHKRDMLNQTIRTKLELEVCRLKEQNKELKEQLDAANSHLFRRHLPIDLDSSSELKREIQRRDQMMAQLIQQNKELMAAKERHEIELAAQRATLQEQRSHIEILDSALSNAQANVLKFEEECRKKQTYVERVAQLQKALTALQVASERREQMERKLRKQLELDLQELRQQQQAQKEGGSGHEAQSTNGSKKLQTSGNMDSHLEPGSQQSLEAGDFPSSSDAVGDLKRAVREKEERIIALETEVSKWEQRYLEENAMRQIAIDAASMPKDAKIAALERTSQESEKLIAQARSEKLKQMDELHASHKRCADMESKIKDLESHLAERDAMIKVLQKHSMERDAALQSAMLRSPLHTPHPSFHTVTASSTASTATIRGSSLSSVPTDDKTASGSLGNNVPVSLQSMTPATSSTNSCTSESLDEQLKKLDSQLLSKDSIIHALRSEKEKYPSHYWMV